MIPAQICDKLSCGQGEVYVTSYRVDKVKFTYGQRDGWTDGRTQEMTIPLRPERPRVKMLNIAIQMLSTIYQLSEAYMMCVQTSHDYDVSVSSLHDQQYSNLTHWGRVTHICVGKLNIIGSDNVIWTNAGILLIRPLGTKFSEILFRNQTFSFKKMHLKMSSAKWRPFCLGLHELIWYMQLIDSIERNDDLHTLSHIVV